MWSGCLNARDLGGLPTRYGVQAAGMFAVAIPNPFVTEAAVAGADLVLGSADQLLLSELLLSAASEGSTSVTE